MKKIILFSILAAAFMSCSEDGPNEVRMRINHYEVPGIMEARDLWNLVQEGTAIGSDDWNAITGIQGFDYELGHMYDLIAVKTKSDPDVMDAPAYYYKLKKVISKEKVADNTSFEIRLAIYYNSEPYMESFVSGDNASAYKLLGKTPIDCADLCEELADQLQGDKHLYGTFVHGDGGLKLIALRQE